MQKKQSEWYEQWSMLQDHEMFLFKEWIAPTLLSYFLGKTVLECGCGGGQHTSFIAPYASQITAVDLNTIEIAKQRNHHLTNVSFIEADIASMNLGREFDIVLAVGVIHHTDNPKETFDNLKRHVKKGGKLITWVYSKEGNFIAEQIIERIRKCFLLGMPRRNLLHLSYFLCAFLYVLVFTVYLLPIKFLPYFEYFRNFRKLEFKRNVLNIFDKLNAPQVTFISEDEINSWFRGDDLVDVHITQYRNVSWRGSAKRV